MASDDAQTLDGRNRTPNADTSRVFYTSARSEAIERVRQRDAGILFFMTVVSAVSGLALSRPAMYPVLLIIPFVGLGATFVVSQHHLIIGALGLYCAREINEDLNRATVNAMQWELSRSLQTVRTRALGQRSYAHFVLLLGPSVLALIVFFVMAFPTSDSSSAEGSRPHNQQDGLRSSSVAAGKEHEEVGNRRNSPDGAPDGHNRKPLHGSTAGILWVLWLLGVGCTAGAWTEIWRADKSRDRFYQFYPSDELRQPFWDDEADETNQILP